MYFPIIRGKQYDLIALRDLVKTDKLSAYVLPIIEPVALSSSLISTIEAYVNKKKRVAIIRNSTLTDFWEEMASEDIEPEDIVKVDRFNKLLNNEYVISCYFATENLYSKAENNSIIIWNEENYHFFNKELSDQLNITANLVPDKAIYRNLINHNTVLLEDSFPKKSRNVDYKGRFNILFSATHLESNSNDVIGHSDYSIIGKDYSENGFAPYAVAIHVVHYDQKSILLISHFVSDDNDSYKDTPAKFGQAMEELLEFDTYKIDDTYGMQELKNYYNLGKYPALGKVKQLTIMHHIELMDNFYKSKALA